MNHHRILLALAFVGITAISFAEDAAEMEESEIAALRLAVVNAKSAQVAGKAFQKYFKRVSPAWPHGLVTLQNDPNTTIALQAAFHHKIVLDPKWEKESGRLGPGHLKSTDAQRFFGFFEGRTKLTLPDWWQEGERRDEFPGIRLDERLSEEFKRIPKDLNVSWQFSFPKDLKVEKAGNGLKLTSGEDSVTLKKNLLDQMEKLASSNQCQIHIVDGKVFFAFFDRLGTTNPLFCVDQATGICDWHSMIWALGKWNGGTSGPAPFRLELGFESDEVVIFGAGVFGNFAESFARKNGHARFRFSSNYWQMWNEK